MLSECQRLCTGITVALALAAGASACSCITPPPPDQALRDANAVFTARVVGFSPGNNPGLSVLHVDLAVRQAWKGVAAEHTAVTTEASDAACGFPFEIGKDYLVYAYRSHPGGSLVCSLCSRTTLLSAAQDDLQSLGKASYIGQLERDEIARRVQQLLWLTGGLVVTVGGIATALVIHSRRVRRTERA